MYPQSTDQVQKFAKTTKSELRRKNDKIRRSNKILQSVHRVGEHLEECTEPQDPPSEDAVSSINLCSDNHNRSGVGGSKTKFKTESTTANTSLPVKRIFALKMGLASKLR